MRLSRQNFCTLLLFYQLFASAANAQTAMGSPPGGIPPGRSAARDSTSYAVALQAYHNFLSPEQALYRGSQYVEYGSLISEGGNPFFGDPHLQKGSVVYNGILYEQVRLLLDIIKDQVIINEPTNFYKIALFSPEVGSFDIGRHHFIRLNDSLAAGAPRVGFYEVLYKAQTSLLKKQRKRLLEDLSTGTLRYLVIEDVSYYLLKDNRYYSVNSKGALLSALKDKSKGANQFIRKNKLSMRTNEENTLLKVVAWYDSQNP